MSKEGGGGRVIPEVTFMRLAYICNRDSYSSVLLRLFLNMVSRYGMLRLIKSFLILGA